jgi:hypothetical protein
VVLVTGVGMSKGLSIAREFYCEGHDVIGADFEPNRVPVCGRFSVALRKFYRLSKPTSESAKSAAKSSYIEELLKIIEKEGVDLWVSCSGVASAVEDAEAAGAVEKWSRCRVIQFGVANTKTLHEKHSFIHQAQAFGLNVPETHYITSVDEVTEKLYSNKRKATSSKFILKCIGLDDAMRADMTLLPLSSSEETQAHLSQIKPSVSKPFVLQQFIYGSEYCTHSVVVGGVIALFIACPSSELLMHYKALSPTSAVFRAMQRYSQIYAEKMGEVTGQFSIDFILGEDNSEPDLMSRLYPIECNPRAHTAVVFFEQESESMVLAYLRAFNQKRNDPKEHIAVINQPSTKGYYWIGHDIITRLVIPLSLTLTRRADLASLVRSWKEFLEHVIYWKDGTYEVWDPWPFWCLYSVYWPGIFLATILTRKWWSRCNVSTTKLFRC